MGEYAFVSLHAFHLWHPMRVSVSAWCMTYLRFQSRQAPCQGLARGEGSAVRQAPLPQVGVLDVRYDAAQALRHLARPHA